VVTLHFKIFGQFNWSSFRGGAIFATNPVTSDRQRQCTRLCVGRLEKQGPTIGLRRLWAILEQSLDYFITGMRILGSQEQYYMCDLISRRDDAGSVGGKVPVSMLVGYGKCV
jgi:hypothetical protein